MRIQIQKSKSRNCYAYSSHLGQVVRVMRYSIYVLYLAEVITFNCSCNLNKLPRLVVYIKIINIIQFRYT